LAARQSSFELKHFVNEQIALGEEQKRPRNDIKKK
jgi:hypothetical protein